MIITICQVMGILLKLSLLLTTILKGRYYCHSHFTDEEMKCEHKTKPGVTWEPSFLLSCIQLRLEDLGGTRRNKIFLVFLPGKSV